MLSEEAVEVAIGLEELLVPAIAAGKEPSPPSAPGIFSLRFLDDELLNWAELHFFAIGFPVVLDIVAEVATVDVSIGER